MSTEVIYYIVRKNVEGAYLLDKRNDIIYTDTIECDAKEIFNDKIKSKQENEIYVLFSKEKDDKYLNILCER
jgi:hypothetical protein